MHTNLYVYKYLRYICLTTLHNYKSIWPPWPTMLVQHTYTSYRISYNKTYINVTCYFHINNYYPFTVITLEITTITNIILLTHPPLLPPPLQRFEGSNICLLKNTMKRLHYQVVVSLIRVYHNKLNSYRH